MKVIDLPIDQVTPYPGNPRRNEGSVAKVAESIKQFGFQQPIVVDEDHVILAGHTRLEAAKVLKLAKVPVHVAESLSEQQKRAYRLMDNRSHDESLWDEGMLATEVEAIIAAGIDPALTGFDADEVQRLLGQFELPPIGEPPESVQQNLQQMENIKAQRKKGKENVIGKSDTEHYLVVVYPTRIARELAVKRLGLPSDERYVDASRVDVSLRVGGALEAAITSERKLSAAPPNKAGATG